MKKVFAAILLILYFTVSTGFTVSLHYCMDRLASMKIGLPHSDKCLSCGMKIKPEGCCKDQVKVIKLQQDNVNAHYAIVHFSAPKAIISTAQLINQAVRSVGAAQNYFTHGPPFISKQDTYLHNCVFRL
jgi:hypothetical protein